MAKRKPKESTPTKPEWENVDSPHSCCECAELADAITELSRQVHLLGRIIDELVSEFHWQNNQLAEKLRTANDFHERPASKSAEQPCQPARRATLFE